MSGLVAVSLCAGVGGIDLALERASIPVVAAVEIDPDCRGVLRRHFPHTTLYDDLTKVTADDLLTAGFVPHRGVIAAGWPCQGNSQAGRRQGMADPRSGLWRHVVRLLAETSAAWFLGENVPGLVTVNNGADIAVVQRDLTQCGFQWAWRILDAQYAGVPQRRRRIFFVGHSGSTWTAPVQVLFDTESRPGHSPASSPARPGTASASARSFGEPRSTGIATLQGGGRRGYRIDAEGAAGGHLIPVDLAQVTSGENRSNPQPGDPAGTLAATSRPAVAYTLRADAGAGNAHNVSYALTSHHSRNDREQTWIAAPLTSEGHDCSEDGTGRQTLIPAAAAVRRLTPLERERLQGFPTDWTRWRTELDGRTAEQSDSARDRQTGNAVAVPCAEWITHRLAAVDASLAVSS